MMGLANPLGALGLAAVGVLIALHLLTRRRRVVPVASLLIWRRIAAQPLARRRFRPNLLFWLRVALLVALSAGLTRPWLRRLDDAAPAPVLAVLDVSASMQTREEDGTRLEQARARLERLLADLSPGTPAMLVAAGDRPRVVGAWTTDLRRLRDALDGLKALDTPTRLGPAVAFALGEASGHPHARVVIATDLPRDAAGLPASDLERLHWIQVGRSDDNAAVAALTVARTPFGGVRDASAVVRSHAARPRTVELRATIDGQPWATHRLELPPHATVPLRLGVPPAAGVLAVELREAGGGRDALAADDRAFAWLPPASPPAVTIVGAHPPLARLLAAATGWPPREIAARDLENAPPAGVLVVTGPLPPVLPRHDALLVVDPPPDHPLCAGGALATGAAVVDWSDGHPLLRGLEALEALEVARARPLTVPPWGEAVVEAAAGAEAFPLLVAGTRDGVRTACLGAGLDDTLAGSDRVPLLVLALATLRWLGEPAAGAVELVTGHPAATSLPGAAVAERAGARAAVVAAGSPPALLATRVGAHRLDVGGAPRLVLANLFDDAESDVGRACRGGGGSPPPPPAHPRRRRAPAGTGPRLVGLPRGARRDDGGVARVGPGRRAGVTGLGLTTPAALVLLVLLPAVWLAARGRPGGRGAASLRALALVAVVLALAGLHRVRERPAGGACVVVAADASDSMHDAGERAARAAAEPLLAALGPRDVVGSVRFAATVETTVRPAAGSVRADALFPGTRPTGDTSETDLAAALAAASMLCPPEKQPALLLVSDGHETRGSVLAEAALARTRLPVFPVVPTGDALPLAEVRRLLVPSLVAAGTRWPLEAVVVSRASTPLDVEVVLTANDEEPLVHAARIPPGTSLVGLPHPLHGPGPLLLEARLRLPPDVPQPVGVAQAALTVAAPLSVLVVSERSPSVIAAALGEQDVDAHVIPPTALRPARLAATHLVVLDNVGSKVLRPEALDALEHWVARGGGLVVTGGPHLFGDAGFLGTPLARLLPTELLSQDPEPEEREPIALELVIDRSNSMGYVSRPHGVAGEKMEYARRAALAVLDQLAPQDVIGAIAFDAQAHELSAPLPASEASPRLAAQIGALRYGGGTDFKDALVLAHDRLAASGPRVRHVVLLTDGDTNRRVDDHYQVIDELARDGITVTAIRIGADTVNLELLAIISEATGGEFHHVPDVEALPQLMIHDARIVMENAARRSRLPVRVRDGGPILAGISARELPEVTRWARTRARPGAEVRLEIESQRGPQPLLVTWQYELGRVAVLPADFQAGAARWPGWSGFGTLWAQLAQWAAAPGLPDDVRLRARRGEGGVVLEVDTLEGDPSPVTVTFAGGDALRLHPSGPRSFAATVGDVPPGLHEVTLRAGRLRRDLDLMVPAHAANPQEHRPGPPNLGLLRGLAEATGGALEATPERILAARAGTERERVALDGWLALVALAAVLGDVAVRRRAG